MLRAISEGKATREPNCNAKSLKHIKSWIRMRLLTQWSWIKNWIHLPNYVMSAFRLLFLCML